MAGGPLCFSESHYETAGAPRQERRAATLLIVADNLKGMAQPPGGKANVDR